MSDFRYDNPEDASMQLNETVMMSEEGPVHLRSYDEWIFQVRGICSYETNNLDIREMGLTFEPLILGYVNYGDTVAYLGRQPKRMWKAGLSYDNVRAISGYLIDEFLTDPSLGHCLSNDYCTLERAFKTVTENGSEVAFHKDVALIGSQGRTIGIEYKGENIGHLGEHNDFFINDKFEYLKEVITEILNEKG